MKVLSLGAIILLGLLLSIAQPAEARVHVFIGGTFGVPVYPYYAPPAYYPYPAPYPYAYPAPPPGAWAPGHWEWRTDGWGRPYKVWVPPYLR
jgi:hypothetical protein